jgi:type III secretion protein V
VKNLRDASGAAYPPPVVLTSMDVRRYLKILLEAEVEGQAVLSYQELPKEAVVHTLARVGGD